MNRPFPQKKNEKRINDAIMAREIIVITETGENLGKMSRDEALQKAEELELDLVEVGVQDGTVMAKVIDYGKFLFKQQKQQSQNKSQAKKTEVKTMKLTYKIGDHDLDIRRKQAESWAKEGHPMKIILQLRGRENQYEDLAMARINEFIASLEDVYKKDVAAKILKQGNNFNVMLYPKK
ncbi:MAG: translation initiation factor IF-3 [Candidatus Gracilibacteria bacterium]|nr:translation initiation factor IF-3 [Candidatus Gracilibacteria bacterium]